MLRANPDCPNRRLPELSDVGVDASAVPEFMRRQNSALIANRAGPAMTRRVSRLASCDTSRRLDRDLLWQHDGHADSPVARVSDFVGCD